MKAELEQREARPDAEQERARRGVPLIQNEARGRGSRVLVIRKRGRGNHANQGRRGLDYW